MNVKRRKDDRFAWSKVAHNIVLVGSVLTALIVGLRVVGGYYVEQEKLRIVEAAIKSITLNIDLIEQRITKAEREIDLRAHRILVNEREIERMRNKDDKGTR